MRPFLQRCAFWLLGLTLASLLVGGLLGSAYGLALAVGGLLVWLGFQLYYLNKLLRWLESPSPDRVPEGMGSWQDVFSSLYRQSRQQSLSQKKLTNALERFINAGEAMPDAVVVLDEHDRIEWLNPMAVEHFQLDRKRDVGNMVANLVRQPGFHDYLTAQNYSQPLLLRLSQPVELGDIARDQQLAGGIKRHQLHRQHLFHRLRLAQQQGLVIVLRQQIVVKAGLAHQIRHHHPHVPSAV